MRYIALFALVIFAVFPATAQTSFSEEQIACFAMEDAQWTSDQFCQDQQLRLKATAKKLAVKTRYYEEYYDCFEQKIGRPCDDLGDKAFEEDSDKARHVALLIYDRGCRLKDDGSCYSIGIKLNDVVSPKDDTIITRAFCVGGAYSMCEDVELPVFVEPAAETQYFDCIASTEETPHCKSLKSLATKDASVLSEIEYSESEFVQCFYFDNGEECTYLAEESLEIDEDLWNNSDTGESFMPSLRTIVIFERGCQTQHAESCDTLSKLLTDAALTTDDRPLFERLCAAGSSYACDRVKVTYQSPRSKEDIEWAQRYFEGLNTQPQD